MSESDASFLDALELRAIVLNECNVRRGEADHDRPGEVATSLAIEPTYDGDDRLLTYSISAKHKFNNSDGQVAAEIDVSMVALYDVRSKAEPSEQAIEEFGATSVVFQVTPFFREFLATMTNRLGMPVFYLPLLKARRVGGLRESKSGV